MIYKAPKSEWTESGRVFIQSTPSGKLYKGPLGASSLWEFHVNLHDIYGSQRVYYSFSETVFNTKVDQISTHRPQCRLHSNRITEHFMITLQ